MEPLKITQLLQDYASGDSDALDKLIPVVYEKLQEMAHGRMRGENPGHTLSTNGLVHEAYLKLLKFDRIDWQDRGHFFAISSQIMRNILVDYASRKKREKRGGHRHRISLGQEEPAADVNLDRLLSIHQALDRLAEMDERRAKVVECRFFGGLNMQETAEALGLSERTAHRDWQIASAWLKNELQ
ncbi:sigma-70 family RNA polymerase sigma factor [Natronogracilivirga saccharolytica]|uniref:Sigma-70 family RNA polymerase sigma factor n=1 Tax=Natronogracilivirga saccharolytica TaxID=2812953 RepID=A0A8J7RL24_9BACT|nr:sigma-70 family RNA polymerase sigma factor [Natronogracilivirga saccharolytica]MBP3193660.1 sigma-70 family RNA polymerase sigma factor [Natronogracilivirga saccharolytica]